MSDALIRLAITQSELFAEWPDEAIARLIEQAELLVIEPGTCVYRSGDTARYLSILVAGSLTLLRDMPSGGSFTAALHLAGDFHGLGPVMARTPQIHTATCKEKTTLVRVPGELLREIVSRNGRLAFPLFAALEMRRLKALNLHAVAAVSSTQTRIAGLLKYIGARSRPGAGINLSQDEIATMLGTRRQVVNRVLKTMAEQGAIRVEYGRIAIVDVDKLDSMSPGF
jgi:CRP/FNR family transcriptional regulator, cyclic AMP receptor protein